MKSKEKKVSKDKNPILMWSTFIFFALMFLFYTAGFVNFESAWIGQSILYIIPSLVATILGIIAVNKYTTKTTHGKTLLWLTLGTAAWFIGELLFTIFDIVGKEAYPTVADVFYLIAYPLFFIGAIIELRDGKFTWSKKLTTLVSSIMVVLLGLTAFFGVYWAIDSEAAFLENFVNIGYGVGDMFLLVIVGLIIIKYAGAFFGKSWMLISLGFFVTWAADILYAIFYDAYEGGVFAATQIDYLWVIGYVLIAFFFYRQKKALDLLNA